MKAISIQPKSIDDRVRLANLFKADNPRKKIVKNLNAAESFLAYANKLAPEDPFVLVSYGDFLRDTNYKKEAYVMLQEAEKFADRLDSDNCCKITGFSLACRAHLNWRNGNPTKSNRPYQTG